METENQPSPQGEPTGYTKRQHRPNLIGGIVLVVLGLLFLADHLLPGFRFHDFWPVILIAIGLGMLWNSARRRGDAP